MRRTLAISLCIALCAAPALATAQGYKAPRNMFGQPDLEGNWTNATITPQVRPTEFGARLVHTPDEVAKLEGASQTRIDEGNKTTDPNAPPPAQGADVGGYNRGWLDPGTQVMRVGGQPRTSILTTADGQVPPRKDGQPNAGARPGGARPAGGVPGGSFDNPEQRPLGERCIISFGRNGGPPMFPNGFYNNNYQIVQAKDHVAIRVEMVHDVRHVRLNAKDHLPADVRPWFGDSIGWYEGDALVVETTNIPQRQQYMGSWRNLKVTERFQRVGKDRILYRFTIEDPTIWEKPWGGEYEFSPLNGEIHEYACHEGNYALEGILAGARAEEAAAAGKQAAAQ